MTKNNKSSAQPADGSFPKPESVFGKAVGLLNGAGTLIILLLMGLITADVLGRNLFSAPIPGVVELTEAGIVMLVYLQVGHTLRVNRFMRSDGFFSFIQQKRPKLAAAMGFFFNLTGAILFLLICYAVRERFMDSWNGDYYIGILGVFTFPVWPIELSILIGSIVMVLQFLVFAKTDFSKTMNRNTQ